MFFQDFILLTRSYNKFRNCKQVLDTKAKLLLLKVFQIFARGVLLMKKFEIEEIKTT